MDIYKENPHISRIIREAKLDEVLEIVKQWKREGKTKEEALEMMDKQILLESDIDKIYADNEIAPENANQHNLLFLKDEELIDYENQPFRTDNEEDNRLLEDSIRVNGIIEPIIVRTYQGKYQILSGHRRRKCGRNVGLTKFPCYIREKTDDEAKLYLVDTNLTSRAIIKPTERAKAYLMRKQALKDEKLKEKVYKDIVKDNQTNLNIRRAIMKEQNVSNGNIQRYLRINYLNQDLQEAIDNGIINLKIAEHLSFLRKEEQNIIANYIKFKNAKINEFQAKMMKEKSYNEYLTKEKIEEIFTNSNLSKKISILFDEFELEPFFDDFKNKKMIKRTILNALENKIS